MGLLSCIFLFNAIKNVYCKHIFIHNLFYSIRLFTYFKTKANINNFIYFSSSHSMVIGVVLQSRFSSFWSQLIIPSGCNVFLRVVIQEVGCLKEQALIFNSPSIWCTFRLWYGSVERFDLRSVVAKYSTVFGAALPFCRHFLYSAGKMWLKCVCEIES